MSESGRPCRPPFMLPPFRVCISALISNFKSQKCRVGHLIRFNRPAFSLTTAFGSPRYVKEHIKSSPQSESSFLERWALQVAWHKRESQKLMLECQKNTESQRSQCIEFIIRPLYNIPQLLGSVQFVLAYPDTEKAPLKRKFPQALFSIKTWSNRVIKTLLSAP